ncbi:MFS transporter [Lactobacillus sp. ESL0791]|uniref:MFS transporter n=1 Tax=Lactobacillus sp. ESL0791 TaxID=2983234 RepID=UPI0023F88D51|nr:MFS transporter [Lactobacillus sp. ESL0791]MDF7639652.1 MFS transporter [Lactobacillus sp. ESL0791]
MKNNKLVASILAIGLLSFLGIVIETSLNIAFPQLMQQFKISAGTVQWLTTGYMLVSTIIIPFGSFLRKRFRAISLFRVAAVTFLLGTLCAAFTRNFSILLCGRLLQGVADGICLPLMFSLILEQAPKSKLGTFMGLGNLVIAFAPAVGPVYGGIILKYFAWNYLFALIVPVIIFAWLLGEISIRQEKPLERVPFDLTGGIMLAIFLVSSLLLVIGLTSGAGVGELVALLVLVAGSCLMFIAAEKKSTKSVLDLNLFKKRKFVFFLLAFFLLQLMSLSMSYLIPNSLQLAFNESSAATGLLVLPAAVIDAVMSIVAGIIYDKVSQSLPIIAGIGIIIGAFVLAKIMRPSSVSAVLTYIIFMVGLGLSYGNIMTLSLSKLDKWVANDGNAIYMTVQPYSGAVGTAVAASIMGVAQKQAGNLAAGTLTGFSAVMLLLMVIAIIAFVLCLVNVGAERYGSKTGKNR